MDDTEVVTTSPEVEKTLTQSQVNEIVRREKIAAADRARREMEASHAQELSSLKSSPSSMGGVESQISPEMEEKMFNKMLERSQKLQKDEDERLRQVEEAKHREEIEKVAQTFHMKMSSGKDKFSDFDEVMNDFDLNAFPLVAFLAADMENTPEIMYELANNPGKLSQLNSLAKESGKMAKKEMLKLSQSIAQNEQAKTNNVTTNAPLSRLKSSTVGADDGKMTLKDLKNQSWLKV